MPLSIEYQVLWPQSMYVIMIITKLAYIYHFKHLHKFRSNDMKQKLVLCMCRIFYVCTYIYMYSLASKTSKRTFFYLWATQFKPLICFLDRELKLCHIVQLNNLSILKTQTFACRLVVSWKWVFYCNCEIVAGFITLLWELACHTLSNSQLIMWLLFAEFAHSTNLTCKIDMFASHSSESNSTSDRNHLVFLNKELFMSQTWFQEIVYQQKQSYPTS